MDCFGLYKPVKSKFLNLTREKGSKIQVYQNVIVRPSSYSL